MLVLLALAGGPAEVLAQASTPASATFRAARTARPPAIDGRLIDEAWAQVEPASDFTQRDPDEGRPATERTEVRFLYDNDALYVAARLHDSRPDLIARRLARRDNSADADLLSIYLDPMHDHLTGAVFRVSASNVQQDAMLYNDSWTDGSWDAVWDSAVTVDERRLVGGDADPAVAAALPVCRSAHLGHERRALHPAEERERLAADGAEELHRPRLASMPHLAGLDGIRPKRTSSCSPTPPRAPSSSRRGPATRSTTARGPLPTPAST